MYREGKGREELSSPTVLYEQPNQIPEGLLVMNGSTVEADVSQDGNDLVGQ